MTIPRKWRLLSSQLVFNHRWCQVRQDVVALPNGTIVDDFFVNVRPDIALILPITVDRQVVFVRQYRHGVGEILLELPAGTFDPTSENAEAAVLRELQEETGYTSTCLTKLATLYDNPVKDTNRIHLFKADPVQPVTEQTLDLTEEIEVVLVPIAQIPEKILAGDLQVAGTLAALLLGLMLNPTPSLGDFQEKL